MEKKNRHIDHLTPELIEAYRKGTLNSAERHEIERLMLENPLYEDGFEGLENLDQSALREDLSALEVLVDQQTQKETKVIPFKVIWPRIAAVLLLLVVAIGLFYFSEDQPLEKKELTQNKKETPAQEESKFEEPVIDTLKTIVEDKVSANTLAGTTSTSDQEEILTDTEMAEEPIKETELFSETEEDFQVFDIEVVEPEITISMQNFDKEFDSIKSLSIPSEAIVNQPNTLRQESRTTQRFLKSSSTESVSIKGRVLGSDDNLPLPQVGVIIKGTTQATATNSDGEFSMGNIPINSTVVMRYLGYHTQEMTILDTSFLNIKLVPDATALGEIVVTGVASESREKVSQPAQPEGGFRSFNRYLKDNLQYPDEANENKIRGRVTLEFTVAEDGTLSNFQIIKSLGYGCDEEAIRLVKEGPEWNPKTLSTDGSAQSSKVRIRVRFRP